MKLCLFLGLFALAVCFAGAQEGKNPFEILELLGLTLSVVDDIKKLRQELFGKRNYDRMARPVKNWKTTTQVNISMVITNFQGIDVQNSILTTEGWLSYVSKKLYLLYDQFSPICRPKAMG